MPILTSNTSNAAPENAVEHSTQFRRRTVLPRRWQTIILFLLTASNGVATPFATLFDASNGGVSAFAQEIVVAKTEGETDATELSQLRLPEILSSSDAETSTANLPTSFSPVGAATRPKTGSATPVRLARNVDAEPPQSVSVGKIPPNAAVLTVDDEKRSTLEIADVEEFSAEPQNAPAEYFSENENAAATRDNSPAISERFDDVPTTTDEKKRDAATPETIADECFCALDPFSSLFIGYEPTAAWTEKALEYVDAILPKLATNPNEASKLVKEFRAQISEGERLKDAIVADDRRLAPLFEAGRNAATQSANADSNADSDSSGSRAPILRYSLEQRLELFDSFRGALDRRAFVWMRAAEFFAAQNAGRLVEAQEIATSELVRLQQTTSTARSFFGDSSTGRNWRTSFEIDLLADDVDRLLKASTAFVPTTGAKIGESFHTKTTAAPINDAAKPTFVGARNVDVDLKLRAKYLRDRLNSVCYKLEKTPMTPEQRRVFQQSPLDEWVAAVVPLACDQTNGFELLLDFEKYEGSGGGHIGRTLQQNARRMTTSRSEVCRKFGKAFDVVYDNPNVKAYISEALINRLLPIKDPEFDVVQETVLNNPVAGRRRTDAQVFIELVPDSSRLLMNLNVAGRVVASTSSTVFPATLHNQSYATYFGQKTLEWKDSGLAYSPTTVSSDSVSKLSSVQTEVDFVPLVGDLAREVVRSQYESKQGAIRQETKARVAREVRDRIDGEANERFDAVNSRLRANFFADLSRLSLSLRTQRSKTTDEWLLASLRLGSDFSLGCQSTEPATLPGAFADLKVHESALNAAFAELDLAGKTLTPRQTVDFLAKKLNKPALANLEIDENDLVFSFADVDPIVVRFFEDRIQLRLKFAELSLGDSSWNDVEIAVSYRPQTDADGSATFVRDGVVELSGPLNIRAQIPLRAIFSKVFPAEKTFDLQPQILRTDERFAGLALGLCRVSRGWFAISVVCPGR